MNVFEENANLIEGDLPKEIRSGMRDLWNARLVRGAVFSEHDIPHCPTYLPTGLPKELISYQDAKTMCNKERRKGNEDFHYHAYVHFYCDDFIFDGPYNSIWTYPEKALDILKHFDGIITPDFSTYACFPDPIKRMNTYRMRAFGYYCYSNNLGVINNARWGTKETWSYCFEGIDKENVIAIGTVASGLRNKENHSLFEDGFNELIKEIHPKTILVYGSSNYPCFESASKSGITILSFESKTSQAFRTRRNPYE